MDILQELALILDAGASGIRSRSDEPGQVASDALLAMRDKAVELHRLNHLPVNTILGDPDGIAAAGEAELAALWHDMLNRTQRRRVDRG